ncbi:hypothetical protein NDU88_010520 [Pleurodeles waltl]|uniref:Uncharacterized protein n=1 Tax=Pleurodeles waltl TaxID=8319 RepID=A0AAV7QWP6_PLEWA|nr:hypothetical protein NDU88_010520 [Pleurodeles waltl]
MIVRAYSCWRDGGGFVIANLSLTFRVTDLCGCLSFGGFRAVGRNSCGGIPRPQLYCWRSSAQRWVSEIPATYRAEAGNPDIRVPENLNREDGQHARSGERGEDAERSEVERPEDGEIGEDGQRATATLKKEIQLTEVH